MNHDPLSQPEYDLLRVVLGSGVVARCLAAAPGGWRELSEAELEAMRLSERHKRTVVALQQLVRRGYPELPRTALSSSAEVGRVYGQRLGGMIHEVIVAVGLDGRNHLLGEVQVAEGGLHGCSIRAHDVLRPLIRMGASAFVLVHNHPGGDPTPSREDVELTRALVTVGEIVGVPLVDHVVIGARGGGYASMYDLGLLEPGITKEKNHEPRAADASVSG